MLHTFSGLSGIPSIDPSTLSNLTIHLDGEQDVYEDAGTDPAEDLDAVQEWHSQVNSHVFSQTTADDKPTWNDGQINGLAAVTGDGTSDYLVKSAGVSFGSDFTSIIVGRTFTSGSLQIIAAERGSVNVSELFQHKYGSANHMEAAARDSGGDSLDVENSSTANSPTVSIARLTGTTLELFTDGFASVVSQTNASYDTGTIWDGTSDGNGFGILAAEDGGQAANFDLPVYYLFDEAKSDGEIKGMFKFLGETFNITIDN